MRTSRLTRTGRRLATVAVCLLVAGCEDHNWRDGFRGRSDQFVYRDINGDDRITRPEWERRYGTVINDPIVVWFDELDCEGDGIVTWPEYYSNLFRPRKSCPKRSAPFPSGSRRGGHLSTETLGAVTFCGTDSEFLRAVVSHKEEPLSKAQASKVKIKCGALVLGKPPYIGNIMGRCALRENSRSSTELAAYSRISIENKNADTTISVVTLSIALASHESSDAGRPDHIKTVSVRPNSEQVITAWFSSDGKGVAKKGQTRIARCELGSILSY